MKIVLIKRLPPFAIANTFALVRVLALFVDGVFYKGYLRIAFGPEALLPSATPPSTAVLALKYLVPIAAAWVIGRIFTNGYNTFVKMFGRGLRMEIE